MKKRLFYYLIAGFTLFILSCPNPTKDEATSKAPVYSNVLWGEWIGIETAGWGAVPFPSFYFSSDKIIQIAGTSNVGYNNYNGNLNSVKNTDITAQVVGVEKASENVIFLKINRGLDPINTYILYPKRIANSSFKGTIVSLDSPKPAIKNQADLNLSRAAIGGIDVIVENLDSALPGKTVITDENGDFTANNTISRDNYRITAEGQIVDVTPQVNGDNVGTISITSGLNFKVSVTPSNDLLLAGGTNYSRSIIIKNIGTQTASAVSYQITPEGESTLSSGILGTIAPGASKTVNITAKCNSISGEKAFKKYNVVITDPINSKVWSDSFSLLFYKSTMTLTFMSNYLQTIPNYGIRTAMRGVVISPERIGYVFVGGTETTSLKNTITLPKISGTYIIAVVWSNYETVYGIDMSIFPTHLSDASFLTQAASFVDTGNYEPNNTEAEAVTITTPIISYLHTGDIDYYKVSID